MALRRLPDGTLEADTVDEMVDYDLKLAARKAAVAAAQPEVASRKPLASTPAPFLFDHARWTKDTAKDFVEAKITARTREIVDVGMRAGQGATTKALAKLLNTGSTAGIGKRLKKVANDSAEFYPGLPIPLQLEGDMGSKTLAIDPAFEDAYREVFGG